MSSLKNRTLKNQYERHLRESTLAEAFDVKKAEAASNAIAKLEALIPTEAAIFRKALEAAKTDLQKASAGGFIQGLKNAIGSDPLLKATAMISALQAGFSALPKVLGMYLPPNAQKEGQKSCFELVPAEKQKLFVDTMTKAFAPEATGSVAGDIKALFSNNVMPYVANLNAAIQEMMMNVAPNGAFKLGQQAAATPAPEIQKATPEQGKPGQAEPAPGQTGQTQATSSSSNAAPTAATTPTQDATATNGTKETAPPQAAKAPTSQKKLNPSTDKERIDNIAYFLASQTGADKAAAQKIIAKLAELNGLTDIATPQKPSNKIAPSTPPPANTPAN